MKKLLLLLLTMLTCVASAYAQTFTDEATGITFNVTNSWSSPGQVQVTKKASGSYKGEITIPSQVNDDDGKTYNVTGIASYAFQDCTGLTSITIPSGVETIGWCAFSGCTKLTSITIPESVTNIEYYAFSGCTKLTIIKIPNSVTSLGGGVFQNCSKLTDVTLSNQLSAIPDGTFSNCTSLTSYTIPDGMTRIDGSAFSGCINLTSITIPNNVETIGGSAFRDCSKLTSIDISHVTQATIESYTFYGCSSLASITIPNTVEKIGDAAFSGCKALTAITIPEDVAEIGSNAFSGCSGLTSINIPAKVETIGSSAFSGCSGLTEITIPKDVTTIAEGTFSGCTGLTSIIIPNGVDAIGGSVFSGCTNLATITIPTSVETIGSDAFSGCSKLTSIDLSSITQTTIGWGTFQNCASLTSITIPASVEEIEGYAFYGCTGLTSITIPDGVETIGSDAFSNCTGLSSITIPKNVTSIESYAFNNCNNIKVVTSEITDPFEVDGSVFGWSWNYNAALIVPKGKIAVYKETSGWNQFAVTLEEGSNYAIEKTEDGIDFKLRQADDYSVYYVVTGISDVSKKEIVIPATLDGCPVKAIAIEGDKSFRNCKSLTKVTIPGSVEINNGNPFYGCMKLDDVNIVVLDYAEFCNNQILRNIDSYVWDDNGNQKYLTLHLIDKDGKEITDYIISEGVTTIGDYAFRGCTGLTSITFPSSLTKIGNYAFYNCTSLTSITIPENVTSIGNSAFGECNGIKVVTSKIQEPFAVSAFNWWYSSATLFVPEGLVATYKEKSGWNGFAYIIEEGETVLATEKTEDGIKYSLRQTEDNGVYYAATDITDVQKTEIVISAEIEGCPVKSIEGWNFFQNCKSLTKITIPGSLTRIDGNPFYGCMKLDDVNIVVSDYAEFCNNQILRNIDSYVWDDNGNNKNFTLHLIDKDGKEITEYIIPEGVTTIGDYAFRGCTGLTSVTIPDGVTSIGNYAFYNCKALTEMTISSSATTIGNSAFYECNNIKELNVIVTDYAEFCNNKILRNFDTSRSYYDSDKEEWVTTYIDIHVLDKDGKEITDYIIPEGVTSIGEMAFKGYTTLSSITIPNSVNKIGDRAFYGCTGLKTVTSEISSPFDVNAFELIAGPADPKGLNTATLFVPKGSRAAYKEKSGWDFALIYEKGETIYDSQQTDKQGIKYTLRQDAKDYSFYYAVTGHTDALKMEIVIPADLNGVPVKAIEGAWSEDADEGAFRGCSDLTSVKIGKNVRSIGDYAFYNCTSLNTVTLPKKLESIGNYAFSGSNLWNWSSSGKYISVNSITSITIPGRVETIGDGAFQGCSELISITFETVEEDEEGGLTSIGNEAFWRCAFATITLPNSVSTIGRWAFAYNEKLATATLGDAITEIKEETFYNCNALTYVAIPDGVTSIGREAFRSCWSLTSLKLPNSLTTIGEQAFDGCQMKSIELPDSYTAIPANMFQSNDFEYIKLGNNIKNIGKNAFGSKLEGEETNVVIEISTATPPTISKDVFPNLPALSVVNVIVPNATIEGVYKETAVWSGMTYANLETDVVVTIEKEKEGLIGTEVLDQCKVAAARVVGLKVKGTINAKDFTQLRSNFKSLLRLDLSECDITEIPDGAMTGKTQLQALTLPTKVKTIGNNAFQGCPYLTGKLDLPTGVTSIGNYAFEGTYYTSITLPRSLKTIGDYAFYKLPIMQKVIIPDGMTSIGSYAFAETAIYGNITIPDGVTKLGDGAFRNTQISSVFLPTGISSLNMSVFQGCNNLDVVYIPDNVTSMSSNAFDGCSTLTNIRLSANLTSMGEYALQNTNVEYIKVPSKVKTLAQGVLKNVKNLESLVLPAYLKTVGAEALYGCSGLRNLSVDAIEPPTAERTSFIGVNTDQCLISIPTESYLAYRNAEYWGLFVQMRNDIAVETEGDGVIAFEAVEEGAEEESLARARTRRFAAVRALRARTRGSEQADELELTYANNGSSVYIPKNGKVNFLIIPGEGEMLQTATLDGEDIMPYIVDGVYTATADKENAKLVVTFSGESQDEGETEYIKIGSAKQVPFCSSFDLDFTNKPELKAYVATGYDKSSGVIWLTRVKQVPAETGFLLMGEAGDYNIPISMSAADVYYKNMFKGTLEGTTIYESEWSERTYRSYTNYYLSNGKAGVGFYKVTKPEGQSIGANRCYLPIPMDIWPNGGDGGTEIIKVGAAKQVPYYTNSWTALDFTSLDAQGVKAYTATGYNYATGTIWLSRVKKVPGNTGILVMAQEAGEYEVPTVQVESYYENMFKGSESAQTIYTNETINGVDYVNYYLSNGASGVGFYKVTKAEGVNMGANRCYLPIPKRDSASGARGMRDEASFSEMVFSDNEDDVIAIPVYGGMNGDDDDATGIDSQIQDAEPDAYYNLQGQRVENPGKGVFIKNGKKVVIR